MTTHIKGTPYKLDKDYIRENNYEELVQLATLLLTDGGMCKHKNTYRIYFTNKSKELIQQFKRVIVAIVPQAQLGTNVHKGVIRIGFYSIELAELLFEFSNSFRTAPCNR